MLPPLVLRRDMLMTIWSWMLVVFATPIILPYDRPLFPTHSARKSPYTMRQVSRNETVHLGEQAPLYTMKKLLTRGRYNRRLATMRVACIDAWYEYSQIISLLSLTVGKFPCQVTSIQQPLSNGLHLPHRCNPLYLAVAFVIAATIVESGLGLYSFTIYRAAVLICLVFYVSSKVAM